MNSNSLENGIVKENTIKDNTQLKICDCNCFRLQKYTSVLRSQNFTKILLTFIVICFIVATYYYSKGYMKSILLWIEQQNSWLIFISFLLFFAIVSFPVTVGYLVLMITSGYLFGIVKGLITVMLGANIGAAIAHITIKSMQNKLPIQRLLKNETGKAILRVIAGPRAFKVVLLARLTPIPFGLQNTIFGVSNVHPKDYYAATLLGLFPAQLINVYIGSSLRSMHDVLNNRSTALTSYGVFAIQVFIGFILMVWVVQKARRELADALLLEIDNSGFKVIVES